MSMIVGLVFLCYMFTRVIDGYMMYIIALPLDHTYKW